MLKTAGDLPELRHLKDVVVFACKGDRRVLWQKESRCSREYKYLRIHLKIFNTRYGICETMPRIGHRFCALVWPASQPIVPPKTSVNFTSF